MGGDGSDHFNSRPHGGRRVSRFFQENDLLFQLTPSRRATQSNTTYVYNRVFQLTPSRRATFFGSGAGAGSSTFQLTPSRRATIISSSLSVPAVFQLTPSRRATSVSQILSLFSSFQLTPSRRATEEPAADQEGNGISTHALTEGDLLSIGTSPSSRNFNSRPHGGRRRCYHIGSW